MAPFSVSELKSRASQQLSATKDRYSSTPSSSAGYNPPHTGSKPPPPPPLAPRGRAQLPFRSGGSVVASLSDDESVSDDRIDWANLTEEDKQIFFSWLDEFFSRYTGRPIASFSPALASPVPNTPQPRHSPVPVPRAPPRPASQASSRPITHAPPSPAPRPPSLPRRVTGGSNPSSPTPNSPPPAMPPRRTPSQSVPIAPPMPPRRTTSSQSTEYPSVSPKLPTRSPSQSSANAPVPPPVRRNLPPPVSAGGPPKVNYMTRPSPTPPSSAAP